MVLALKRATATLGGGVRLKSFSVHMKCEALDGGGSF